MERFPEITERIRLPLRIQVPSYLMDHQYRGKAVLPAVEAMEILAASTLSRFPETPVHRIADARFDKFLVIEDGRRRVDAFNDLAVLDNGAVISKLVTRTRSGKAMITRTREHAVLCFHDFPESPDPIPLEMPETPGYHVPREPLYRSLVPFGPGYQNLKEGVTLFKNGAEAAVYAPPMEGLPTPLGSPFPLDAAFHAACVWGQRHAGMVGFPVAFRLRRLFAPTRSENTYTAAVLPKAVHSDRFLVDIWIAGMDGVFREAVLDVVMRDVSGGGIKPPSWIVQGAGLEGNA